MKNYQPKQLFFLGWLLAVAGLAAAEPVDPRGPRQWQKQQAAADRTWTRWPRARIQQLEAERDQLLEQIAVLPQHDPKMTSDHLGYHSLFGDPDSPGSLSPHLLDAKLVWPHRLDSIALSPAFNPLESEGGVYAFPKRFKIEVLNDNTDEFEVVVNWMEEDFPDPGPYPVFFSGINRLVKQVRVTVPQVMRESGAAYYALGEIYLFRNQNGQLADNMAAWGSSGIEIEVSDSFSMPPQWDAEYLYDSIVGLGLPLSEKTVASEDLMVTYENDAPILDPVQLVLDLGHVQRIGRIELWPAEAPYLLALPSIGFPRRISVELSANAEFEPSTVIEVENVEGRMHRDNRLTVICQGYEAQYIRIILDDLREYKGKRILGLGEISVSEYGIVSSVGCKVAAQGIPAQFLEQLPRLVDGYSRHRRILPEAEWIKGLAKRRPLDRRLVVVERELTLARATWRTLQYRSGVFFGTIICMGLVGGVLFQKRQRRLGLNKLKRRITRDLHDEVGSSLGSISLTAEQLKHAVEDVEIKEEISDLSLMAREACASLREVVWVIDQSTIRLPALIEKMVERAERVLRGVEVVIDVSPEVPDVEVSLSCKRHLIMFFREAVHNCARHAAAKEIRISARIVENRLLEVSVQDDGRGFDLSGIQGGWGLDSMKERAEELRGTLDLRSAPGEGTLVRLTLPLDTLPLEPTHAYKTSN